MPAVQGFLDKYLFHKQSHDLPPPISTGTAVGLLALYTAVYVAPFYLSSLTRPSATLSRDAPSVIRARIASVTLSCAVCCAATFLLLTTHGAPGTPTRLAARDALHLMGAWPLGLREALRALLLTAGLFLGPLFEHLVVERGWRAWAPRRSGGLPLLLPEPLADLLADWTVWRNLVAGPVTEEVLFRAAAVPLLLLAHTPVRRTVLLSPVVFGLAHLHHAYEFAVTHPRVPLAAVAARALLQFAYTTLFGCYATFLYLRSGSLLAVCLVHSFCNSMGLPRLWGRVQRDHHPDAGAGGGGGGEAVEAKRDGPAPPPPSAPRPPRTLLWTLAYYVLLVAGAAFWYRHLWSLTESPLALVSFGEAAGQGK